MLVPDYFIIHIRYSLRHTLFTEAMSQELPIMHIRQIVGHEKFLGQLPATGVRDESARLGIEAPKNIEILREEIDQGSTDNAAVVEKLKKVVVALLQSASKNTSKKKKSKP